MLVEGAILDIDGPRPAYVRIERGRVTEVGAVGTDSTRGRERRVRGVVVPAPMNGHTHLGDAVSTREPPAGSFSELVAPPFGYKFRLLAEASPAAKVAAMRTALVRMRREGMVGTIDFREEGVEGVRALRSAARGASMRAVILGRPASLTVTASEVEQLLAEADGIGLSSAREVPKESRRLVARLCRRRDKFYALHASEELRERVDDYLDPRPDLLVHLTRAAPADLETVRDARVSVAVCPRSNALFGRRPLLQAMERLQLSVLLGTDNAMLNAPSIWRELEFAYVGSRLRGAPVSAGYLARAALVEPWRWLGVPAAARIAPGTPATPLVFRLPPDDPAYQLVTRATEHLIVRPARTKVAHQRRGRR
jgi:cytosine/adenosine deaminase-related metal-dependent hydrolase